MNHHVPAKLHHIPITFITIGGSYHAASTRSDAKISIFKLRAELLKAIYVLRLGFGSDIATVKNTMDTDSTDAFIVGLLNHLFEVLNVAMNSTIRKNATKVKGGMAG